MLCCALSSKSSGDIGVIPASKQPCVQLWAVSQEHPGGLVRTCVSGRWQSVALWSGPNKVVICRAWPPHQCHWPLTSSSHRACFLSSATGRAQLQAWNTSPDNMQTASKAVGPPISPTPQAASRLQGIRLACLSSRNPAAHPDQTGPSLGVSRGLAVERALWLPPLLAPRLLVRRALPLLLLRCNRPRAEVGAPPRWELPPFSFRPRRGTPGPPDRLLRRWPVATEHQTERELRNARAQAHQKAFRTGIVYRLQQRRCHH